MISGARVGSVLPPTGSEVTSTSCERATRCGISIIPERTANVAPAGTGGCEADFTHTW